MSHGYACGSSQPTVAFTVQARVGQCLTPSSRSSGLASANSNAARSSRKWTIGSQRRSGAAFLVLCTVDVEKDTAEDAQRAIEASRGRVRKLEARYNARRVENNAVRARRVYREWVSHRSLPSDAKRSVVDEDVAFWSLSEKEVLQELLADLCSDLEILEDVYAVFPEVAGRSVIRVTEVVKELKDSLNSLDEKNSHQAISFVASPNRDQSESAAEQTTAEAEDATVDFKNFRMNVQGKLEKLGEIWARLNGLPTDSEHFVVDRSKSELDSERTSFLRKEVERLERQLQDASKQREARIRTEDQLGKLIRAKEIREMDDVVIEIRRCLAVRVLELEMEIIYSYLESEIDVAEELMDEQPFILEFGALEEQLVELSFLVDQSETLVINDDTLASLAERIQFLKSSLGLENDLFTTQITWNLLRSQLGEMWRKAREGGDFYARGLRLFGGDVKYASRLVQKAAVGSVLTPREVRTLRRTARDLITLVPFTVILIAPLTPVGHVLIFSFIQRFFPDFFPSTFSEGRVNLMRAYEKMIRTRQEGPDPLPIDGPPPTTGVETPGDTSRILAGRGLSRYGRYGREDIHLAD
uniref:Letm1 RBD domain-containing protein n=1 Tax=Compsopogon caeruleus TaxID=31354 RepID=A0A7S1XD73_9RHOD|mmetsp:Transcript_18401/g.38512  ORF Transcript_18401/g.38512 Transcript_18401/m.38512 type:complete len:585 (+) Transcript_18401:752-2506(+)